jgi:RNA 2',3'-cyclic 3'-phosphodiesterase
MGTKRNPFSGMGAETVAELKPRRLFVSLNPDPQLIDSLAQFQSSIRRRFNELLGAEAEISWNRPAQFHLTLVFLGPVAEAHLPKLTESLRLASASVEPLQIQLTDFGTFPAVKHPRVVWMGIRQNAKLEKLMDSASNACERALGKGAGERAYPHLTLGRVRDTTKNPGLGAAATELRKSLPETVLEWTPANFYLMESIAAAGRREYKRLASFRMGESTE